MTQANSFTVGGAGLAYPNLYCIIYNAIACSGDPNFTIHLLAELLIEMSRSTSSLAFGGKFATRFALTRGSTSIPLNDVLAFTPTTLATYKANGGVEVLSTFEGKSQNYSGSAGSFAFAPLETTSMQVTEVPPAGVFNYALWYGADHVDTRPFTKFRQYLKILETKR